MADYEDRRLEELHATEVQRADDGWITVSTEENAGFSFKPDNPDVTLPLGPFALETKRGLVTGVASHGIWLMHKTDEDLAREHEEFKTKRLARLRSHWERHREEWQRREDALPDWIKPRLATFHEHGGETFEIDGWSYELQIAELAVMYRESGGEDSPSISEYAAMYGTSSNQHGFAKQLAAAPPEVSLADTVSALTPLGAHPFYASKED